MLRSFDTDLLCPGRKGRGCDVFHAISDGKRDPFTEIGVALIRFSGYEIGVQAIGALWKHHRFRGVSFCLESAPFSARF